MKNRTRAERRALTRKVINKRQKMLLQYRGEHWDNPLIPSHIWKGSTRVVNEWGYAKFFRQGNRLSKWNVTYRNGLAHFEKTTRMSFSHHRQIVEDPDDLSELLSSAQLHKVMHPGPMSDPWDWD